MRRTVLRLVAAALAVALFGPAGPAYLVRKTSKGIDITWNVSGSAPNVVAGQVTYYIDQASAVDVTGSEFATAIRGAVQAWEDAPAAAIAFSEDPTRAASDKSSSDKINRFGFNAGVLPAFVFASAFTATTNNKIVDVDVVFNSDGMDWAVSDTGDGAKADVQGVATHEWGHGIGLDHVPQSRAVMFWAASYGNVHQRNLRTDDLAGAGRAYPAAAFSTDLATVKGRALGTGGSPLFGVQVAAIDFTDGFPAASALTLADGTYAIDGLPPGVYQMVAGPIGTKQLEGGVYSTFWGTAATSLLPAVRGQDGAADGSTGVHQLSAGQTLTGIDFTLAASVADASNDSSGVAIPIAVDGSRVGRIESSSDKAFYSFPGTAGQRVSIYVHAQEIGSALNPKVFLRSADGTAIATNDNINSNALGEEPPDYDARILDFPLTATETHYVEVQTPGFTDTGHPEDQFYVVTLLGGGGTANAFTSRLTATPSVIPADGATASTLTFTPKGLTGTLVGPGKTVAMTTSSDGDADGTLSAVTDNGDGTYTATITAPSAASGDTVQASVDGVPVSTAAVSFRGPADPAASELTATPRRIRFDGESTAALSFVPRDANGVPFDTDQDGISHTVLIRLASAFDVALGTTAGTGGGAYGATMTAGTTEGEAAITADVDGTPLGGSFAVSVGFPLEDVVDDDAADLTAALAADPPPPAKSVKKLTKARDLLVAAGALSAATDSVKIVAAAGKALKQLEGAMKKGAVAAADVPATELAEAAREAALLAIDAAEPNADTAPEQAALAKAGTLFDAGETLLDSGLRSKSVAKYLAALKKAVKILP